MFFLGPEVLYLFGILTVYKCAEACQQCALLYSTESYVLYKI